MYKRQYVDDGHTGTDANRENFQRLLSDVMSGKINCVVVKDPVSYTHLDVYKRQAYERWAKVYNLKQMAAALQYLQEHHLTDYAALTASTEAAAVSYTHLDVYKRQVHRSEKHGRKP